MHILVDPIRRLKYDGSEPLVPRLSSYPLYPHLSIYIISIQEVTVQGLQEGVPTLSSYPLCPHHRLQVDNSCSTQHHYHSINNKQYNNIIYPHNHSLCRYFIKYLYEKMVLIQYYYTCLYTFSVEVITCPHNNMTFSRYQTLPIPSWCILFHIFKYLQLPISNKLFTILLMN